jgi:transposase-like protein
MPRPAAEIVLDAREIKLLEQIVRSRTLGTDLQTRARIVLAAAQGKTNLQIQKEHGIEKHRVSLWRNRFFTLHEQWKKLDTKLRPKMNEMLIREWFADTSGRGRKPRITEEQKARIIAMACESPKKYEYEPTQWTNRLLAKAVVKQGIVESITHKTVWYFLKGKRTEAAQKPVLPEGGGEGS